MPINRETFDADLAAFTAGTTDYIAAVDAFIALPPVIDLANEDATVQAALTAVNEAKARIPNPTSPKA
jgi:hypothetical protein